MTRVVLFDLDGTLVDTAPELSDALNATLAGFGLGPVAEDQVRQWIGDGARALLSRALDAVAAPPAAAQAAWDRFAVEYAERCGQRSTVHAGARPLLARLRAQGVRLAVLTNKEGRFAQRVLAAHDLLHAFDLIVAGDTLATMRLRRGRGGRAAGRRLGHRRAHRACRRHPGVAGEARLPRRCAGRRRRARWLPRPPRRSPTHGRVPRGHCLESPTMPLIALRPLRALHPVREALAEHDHGVAA
jgi:phosphoglycolate phosphatase-like HAD superfamily hydrolase